MEQDGDEELEYQRRLDEVAALIVEEVIAGVTGGDQQEVNEVAAGGAADSWAGDSSYATESNTAFVEHMLPSKGFEILQPWSLPIPLDKAQMSAGNWKSENQAAFDQRPPTPQDKMAGSKSAQPVRAPTFFAWSLDAVEPRAAAEDEAIPGLSQSTLAGPMGLSERDTADQWQSEYAAANAQSRVAPTTLAVAGAKSPARERSPAFYVWPVADQRAIKKAVPLIQGTESADRFNWPIDETSPTLVPMPPPPIKPAALSLAGSQHAAPFGVYSTASSEAAWRSEYAACFHDPQKEQQRHDEAAAAAAAVAAEAAASIVAAAAAAAEEEEEEEEADEEEGEEQQQQQQQPPRQHVLSASRAAMPPPAPVEAKPRTKRLRFLTEHQSSFTWPARSGRPAPAPVHTEPAAPLPDAKPLTVFQACYQWPALAPLAPPRKSSNHSDPTMLFHVPAIAGIVDVGPATEETAQGETLEDALCSVDSLAATAQPTTADTISTNPRGREQQAQQQRDDRAENISVPASSVTGPTTKSARRGVRPVGARPKGLAVVGKAIAPPAAQSAAAAAAAPSSRQAGGGAGVVARVLGRARAGKKGAGGNPVLHNVRYPSTSDRQNGRWVTEARAAFAYRPPTKVPK